MNIALEIIKKQILPFVDDNEKQQVSNLENLDEAERFIERFLENDDVIGIQSDLISTFEQPRELPHIRSGLDAEMPLFDSLEKPDYLGFDEDVPPSMSRLNETLHDFEHYVAKNLSQVALTRKIKPRKFANDRGIFDVYIELVSKSDEFSRLKKVYVLSIHHSIENPAELHTPVKTVNRVLGQAKEIIDSINSLKIENDSRKTAKRESVGKMLSR